MMGIFHAQAALAFFLGGFAAKWALDEPRMWFILPLCILGGCGATLSATKSGNIK